MLAVIEEFLGELSKGFCVCYDVLQANGGDKDGGQMVVPVENRMCPSGVDHREFGSFCYSGWILPWA